MIDRRRKTEHNTKKLIREVQNEMFDEWLERQYARFGRWTIKGIKIGLVALVIKLVMLFVTIKVGDFNLLDIAPQAEKVTPHVR